MSTLLPPVGATSIAGGSDRDKLAASAKGFEALLLRQMLSAARKADLGDTLFGDGADGADGAMGTFRQMQDDHIADLVADTGSLGLSTMIEAQLARYLPKQG